MSTVPMVPLLNDDDTIGALAAARWPLKVRTVAIEFRDAFDGMYGDTIGCPRASKLLKRHAAATTIYNWLTSESSITSASKFDALITDFSALARVHTLKLDDLPLVTDVGIAALAHVHTLELWRLPLVTDVGIAALAHVHTLDVQQCGCNNVSRAPLTAH